MEQIQALEQREPIFPVLATAGLLAPGQQGSEKSASGVQQGQVPDLRETKEQTGTRAQNRRESKRNRQGREPGISKQCTKQGRRKENQNWTRMGKGHSFRQDV